MRIAQVSSLVESVPPRQYGGTERIASYLTEELVRLGHEVTLFASGDSVTQAELDAPWPRALRSDGINEHLAPHLLMLEKVLQRAADFDIVHFHTGYVHFPLCRRLATSHITTHHGRLDIPELLPFYREFEEVPVISISNNQRTALPWANWQGTVYNGVPEDLYRLQARPGTYLAFLGRISPEKGLDHAIEIARRAGMELRIAAKVDAVDREYFDTRIRPLLNDPQVQYTGEIDDDAKQALLGDAYAVLFPIDWPEPFGLVMVEAMACGTPVIAYRRGSVPEIMQPGVTGFIVTNVDEAVAALDNIGTLERHQCRRVFEEHFSVKRMAQDYLSVYERLQGNEQPRLAG
ncbi:MAG: glycosyltransferase family 4 protein [Halobacteria archaeon]|nr:glycosyltransferase family 4 protein [Halobacteria archaeon]